jgi:hypothetical protein
MKSDVPRLTKIVDEVMADHQARLLAPKCGLHRRGKREKRRPDTALISQAVAKK